MAELVKSISYDQGEIIRDILKLHVPEGEIDCDPTFSTGAFYYSAGIEVPKLRFDIRPQVEGVVQADARSLPVPNESISCMMLDPPFLATTGASLGKGESNRINRRFSVYPDEKSLHQCYADIQSRFLIKRKQNSDCYVQRSVICLRSWFMGWKSGGWHELWKRIG